ncbi:MAG TPA: hypothetical protein V6D19_24135 [Stenomitos sp.]
MAPRKYASNDYDEAIALDGSDRLLLRQIVGGNPKTTRSTLTAIATFVESTLTPVPDLTIPLTLTNTQKSNARINLGLGSAALANTSAFEAAGAVSAAFSAHLGATDPHTQYLTQSRGDARYPLKTDADPYPQYQTQAEGDIRYPLKAAGGDLSGNLPSPTVAKIQGRAVASTAPTNGQALIWNETTNQYEPGTVAASSGGHTIRVNGVDFTQRGKINFTGPVSGTDDPTNDQTIVAITASEGGGIAWTTQNASTFNAAANSGNLLTLAANQQGTLPEAPAIGQVVAATGASASGIKSLIAPGGAIFFPDGTNNTGVRTVSGQSRASIELLCTQTSPVPQWIARLFSNQTHWELFAAPTTGPGADVAEAYRVAELAAGYTMTTAEINAMVAFVNTMHSGGWWTGGTADTFAWYPLLGANNAQQRINAVTPGTGDLTNIDGTLTYNSSGFTGNGSIYAGSAFHATHWTSSNYRAAFMAIENLPSGSINPIWGLEGFTGSYIFGSGAGTSLKIHSNVPDNTLSGITFPFTGIAASRSRDAGSSQVFEKNYINGTGQSNSETNLARTTNTDFRPLRSGGVNPPSGTVCRGFLLLKSNAGLSDANMLSINNALAAFLSAIGR